MTQNSSDEILSNLNENGYADVNDIGIVSDGQKDNIYQSVQQIATDSLDDADKINNEASYMIDEQFSPIHIDNKFNEVDSVNPTESSSDLAEPKRVRDLSDYFISVSNDPDYNFSPENIETRKKSVGKKKSLKNKRGAEKRKKLRKESAAVRLSRLFDDSKSFSQDVQSTISNYDIAKEVSRQLRGDILKNREYNEQRQKEEALLRKEQKFEENMNRIFEERHNALYEKYLKTQQRAEFALNKKVEYVNEYRLSAYNKLLKGEYAEDRKLDLQRKQELILQERAARRWLKQRFAAQLQRQLERRKVAAAKQRLRWEEEATNRVLAEKRGKLQTALRKKNEIMQAVNAIKNNSTR